MESMRCISLASSFSLVGWRPGDFWRLDKGVGRRRGAFGRKSGCQRGRLIRLKLKRALRFIVWARVVLFAPVGRLRPMKLPFSGTWLLSARVLPPFCRRFDRALCRRAAEFADVFIVLGLAPGFLPAASDRAAGFRRRFGGR